MSKTNGPVFTGSNILKQLTKFIKQQHYTKIFVLADESTFKHCYPQLKKNLPQHSVIKIKSGEENKTIVTCEKIWAALTLAEADRNAALINLGGGVITDLGGFAAGCYKRGIAFIQVPTTLLAMVDASVGGKTGVDFMHFKNQIGMFRQPDAVFIYSGFLSTLSDRHIRAGLAEVIKHYLIASPADFVSLTKQLEVAFENKRIYPVIKWDELIARNVAIKQNFVEQDVHEKDVRKALNFGHTAGHAIEAYFLSKNKSCLHGEAIMLGLFTELSISVKKGFIPPKDLLPLILPLCQIAVDNPCFHKKSIKSIISFMKQDKKNRNGQLQFTLLKGLGNYVINQSVKDEWIYESLEWVSEFTYQYEIKSSY
jgi:3-dehydroquinate synthase